MVALRKRGKRGRREHKIKVFSFHSKGNKGKAFFQANKQIKKEILPQGPKIRNLNSTILRLFTEEYVLALFL